MKRSKTLLVASLMALCSMVAVSGCTKPQDSSSDISASDSIQSEVKLFIDESLIPTGGIVGKEIVLPAATATDVDGSNITDSILLTVAGIKDGAEMSWPIYRQAGGTVQKFMPTRYTEWKITYSVVGADGETVTKTYNLTLAVDETKPVLSVSDTSDITVTAGNKLTLPSATATDDGEDISSNIKVKFYNENGALLDTYKTEGASYAIKLPSGTYKAVYSCVDGAGNEADEVEIGVTVNRLPYDTELLSAGSIKNGYATRMVGNDLSVGFISTETYDSTDCSSVTLTSDKIGLNDIVGITATFDPTPTEGGENFYTMGYYASKSSDSLAATGKEAEWPNNFFIRIFNSEVSIYSVNGDPKDSVKVALKDGAAHTIYMQTVRTGESATADDASVIFRVWIDTLPTEAATISVTVTANSGEYDADTFASYWNGTAGWLYFGSYINQKEVYNDDVMTVKSVKLFEMSADEFFAPLPEIVFDGTLESVYEKNEEIALPSVSFNNAAESSVKVYGEDGQLIATLANDAVSYKFAAAGIYTLVYMAKSEDGIEIARKFTVTIINSYDDFTIAYPTTIGVAENPYNEEFAISNAQSGNDQVGVQILNDSGDEKLVAVKMKVTGFMESCWFGLQISGSAPFTNWLSGSGLVLNIGDGKLFYGMGGKESANAVAATDKLFGLNSDYVTTTNGVNVFELCLVYRLNYVGDETNGLNAIELEVWYGSSFDAMTKASFRALEGKVSLEKSSEVVEEATKPTISAKFIYELGVSESTYGQGAGVYFMFAQGGQDWKTSKAGCTEVKLLEAEPAEAPVFSIVKPETAIYYVNNQISVPTVEMGDNVSSVSIYYMDGDNKVSVDGETITFATVGDYVLYYEGVSTEGIKTTKTWSFTVIEKSNTVDMPANLTSSPSVKIEGTFEQMSGQAGAASATQITDGLGNGKYTYVTIRQDDYNASNLCQYGLQITGNSAVGSWFNNGTGLYIVLKDNNIILALNGREDSNYICYAPNVISSASKYVSGTTLQISLAIKATYVVEGNGLVAMQIELWAKAATGVYEKIEWQKLTKVLTEEQSAELISEEDNTVVGFTANILNNLYNQGYTDICEQGAGVLVAHAQGPAAKITVSGVFVSDEAPQTEIYELAVPTVGEVSVSNTTGSKKAAQHGDDNNIEILSNSGNGQLVAMKLSMKEFNTNNPGFFGVQILGSDQVNSWMNSTKGLFIFFGENNAYIGYTKEGADRLAKISNIAGPNGGYYDAETKELSFYLAYKVNYVTEGDNLAGVKVSVWIGSSLDNMQQLTWTKENGTDEMVATAGEFYLSAAYITENELDAKVYSQGKVYVTYAQGGMDDGSTLVAVSDVQLLEAFPTQE